MTEVLGGTKEVQLKGRTLSLCLCLYLFVSVRVSPGVRSIKSRVIDETEQGTWDDRGPKSPVSTRINH